MRKLNKMMMVALIASAISGTAYAAGAKLYDDVPTNHWAYAAVADLTEKGLLVGMPNGTFKGNKPMTRYSFAVVVSRMLDRYNELLKTNNEVSSKDVKALEDLVTEFVNEIEALSDEVKEIKSDVKSVKADVSDVKDNVSELNTKTTALEKKVNQIGNVKVYGDVLAQNIAYEKTNKNMDHFQNIQVRVGFSAKPTDKVEADFRYVAYDKDMNSKTDRVQDIRDNGDHNNHDYNGFSKSAFGRAEGKNEVEIAKVKVKNVFKDGDHIQIGRDFMTHGHALVLNDYADAVQYSTKAGDVTITGNAIFSDFDNNINEHKKGKQIWNANADVNVKGHNIYAGVYVDEDKDYYNVDTNENVVPITLASGETTPYMYKDSSRVITELGSSGNLSKDGKVRYDVAMVTSTNERKNMKNDGRKDKATGFMEHVGLAWDANPNLTVKAAYTTADEKFDGIISLDKTQGSVGGQQTPFDDIARFQNLLGGMMGDKFYNTSDFKFQLEYAFANKQSIRFAYDLVKENDSQVKTGFTSAQPQDNWNMTYPNQRGTTDESMNKLDAKIATLEYKYQFDPSSRISVGFTNADLGKCRDANDNKYKKDEQLFWTELYSKF